ncbi:unnamed protein product [Blumeria hordei]|uniref:MYND-type domain-containing protein n=1 Tax=Blumeria hordei TaxID=2867405 RepID=A0A383UID8_BLUHO|nr:unnamed protein product [Blumeria hordei]
MGSLQLNKMRPACPDLTSPLRFPCFAECPLASDGSRASMAQSTYLLGTIHLEATVSTSPTYICLDRVGAQFAVTIQLPPHEVKEGVRGGGFDLAAWKRGWCLAIRRPQRFGVDTNKQGFIAVEKDDVMVIPTSLAKLMDICLIEKERDGLAKDTTICQACGVESDLKNLRACRGCGYVWYCNKECQLKGWSQKGHKSKCKVLNVLKNFPQD